MLRFNDSFDAKTFVAEDSSVSGCEEMGCVLFVRFPDDELLGEADSGQEVIDFIKIVDSIQRGESPRSALFSFVMDQDYWKGVGADIADEDGRDKSPEAKAMVQSVLDGHNIRVIRLCLNVGMYHALRGEKDLAANAVHKVHDQMHRAGWYDFMAVQDPELSDEVKQFIELTRPYVGSIEAMFEDKERKNLPAATKVSTVLADAGLSSLPVRRETLTGGLVSKAATLTPTKPRGKGKGMSYSGDIKGFRNARRQDVESRQERHEGECAA